MDLGPEHLRRFDELSAPALDHRAPVHGALRAVLQFAGTSVEARRPARIRR
ncbi:hypothetical protein POF50_015390 [Streptomyces sp. SL13]|uniref:Uncharacterized protein n=1 Tax=Streptantibioticus silvisoli TaxID=2705255 RepID=A0AA90H4L8_9ACTN|nr:hypothetical protein [Streptantibioticus silvisoli]MDI5970705.1 hypothetical protein [Streptantibioticus silvisoli]